MIDLNGTGSRIRKNAEEQETTDIRILANAATDDGKENLST